MTDKPVVDVDRIDGKPRTVRELFTSRKYSVDYYQREYAWTQANVIELLDDLTGRFLDSWDESHEREDTLDVPPVLPRANRYEQPRRHAVPRRRPATPHHVDAPADLLAAPTEGPPSRGAVDVEQFIASTRVGKWSFNLDVEDRRDCMQALLEGVTPVVPEGDESVENLWARYQDVEQLFPQELKDRKLPFFIDWLLERVAVVEIATSDQEMALEIFETMNDRGLRLTTTDMLKSYLLAMIRDPEKIESANRLWRGRVAALEQSRR